jgi:hypothetical protein
MKRVKLILFSLTGGIIYLILNGDLVLSDTIIMWILICVRFYILGSIINVLWYYYDYFFASIPYMENIKIKLNSSKYNKFKFHFIIITMCVKDSWYGLYETIKEKELF